MSELQPGDVLRGKYEILGELGRGGMGVVYRARHVLLNEVQALKLLLDARPEFVKGFLAEAQLVRRLRHPSIVEVFDVDVAENGFPFVVMEFLEGPNLRALLDRGTLAPPLALHFAAEVCDALAFAHHRGVIHRDVKPQNILLSVPPAPGADPERVKVIDFGIAKVVAEADVNVTGMLTAPTGFALGTPEYSSPEQAMGMPSRDLDARSDLYSVGLVLYEMLSGVRPFSAPTPMGLLVARLQQAPRPILDACPGLDPRLAGVVMHSICSGREDRFQTGEEMADALRSVRAAVLGLPQPPPRPATAAPAPTPRPPAGFLDTEVYNPPPAAGPAPPPAPVPPLDAAPAPTPRPGLSIGTFASSETTQPTALSYGQPPPAPPAAPGVQWPPSPGVSPVPPGMQTAASPAFHSRPWYPPTPKPRRSGLWIVLAAVGVLAVLAVAGWFLAPRYFPQAWQRVLAIAGRSAPPAQESAAPVPASSAQVQQPFAAVPQVETALPPPPPSPASPEAAPAKPPTVPTAKPPAASAAKPPAPTPPQPSKVAPVASGGVRVNPKDGLKYVSIPFGEFMMGCSDGDGECTDAESPAHGVRITRGFWIGQTSVTVAAWKKYRAATSSPALLARDNFGRQLNEAGDDSLPAVALTWEEARAFCQWSGGRLPTEAEWEYAARAGNNAARYGALEVVAWFADDSGNSPLDANAVLASDRQHYAQRLYSNGNAPHPVGTKQPNAWHLYDTLGNVWNWVADWYGDGYYGQGAAVDPAGPPSGTLRILRGGSWSFNSRSIRVSNRLKYAPNARVFDFGCRCARDQAP